MSTAQDAENKMKIAFIGKFQKLHDEEYIAQSFEMLGHTVIRIQVDESSHFEYIYNQIIDEKPQAVIYCKLKHQGNVTEFIKRLKHFNIKVICWVFDLYIGYPRENLLIAPAFRLADYVVTTDGGHEQEFKEKGINHYCVRQGIYKPECYMEESERSQDIVFIGSHNPLYPYRNKVLNFVKENYQLTWLGATDTNEVRGRALNALYGTTKLVLGDSVYSPHYWSNRVVETLGRGGFLIHPNVPGIEQEYPYLVTYKYDDFEDLKSKIDFYLSHDKEREDIRKWNFEWVRDKYTMDKKCEELLKIVFKHE